MICLLGIMNQINSQLCTHVKCISFNFVINILLIFQKLIKAVVERNLPDLKLSIENGAELEYRDQVGELTENLY